MNIFAKKTANQARHPSPLFTKCFKCTGSANTFWSTTDISTLTHISKESWLWHMLCSLHSRLKHDCVVPTSLTRRSVLYQRVSHIFRCIFRSVSAWYSLMAAFPRRSSLPLVCKSAAQVENMWKPKSLEVLSNPSACSHFYSQTVSCGFCLSFLLVFKRVRSFLRRFLLTFTRYTLTTEVSSSSFGVHTAPYKSKI